MSGLLQHTLDCDHPFEHVTRGVTKDLVSCSSCHAEQWVTKPLPGQST